MSIQRSTVRLEESLLRRAKQEAAVLNQPHCRIVHPGPRHWDIFTRLCGQSGATGNLVADAWLAALAIESGRMDYLRPGFCPV